MIVAFCGPPAAGKTTIASGVRDALEDRDRAVRLCHSEDVSSPTYERLYRRAADASAEAEIVLVDGTFYKREWQTQFRTLGDVRYVHVTAALETCLERNRRRAEPIDEQGVHVVYREFHEPDADLVIDTDELSVETAVERVVDAIERWED